MSNQAKEQTGPQIISNLLSLTRKMAASEDADFLTSSIDKREILMAEYDRLKASSPRFAETIEENKAEITKMINEIIELDKQVNKTLVALYSSAKHELEDSNTNNKILNYTKNAISASGSYMDYKK